MSRGPNRSSYDVVVAGAGVVGLAAAWRLRQRGLTVLVVERGRAGSGASGVAAGMLAPVTEADFGEERLLALNLAGLERWPSFAAELRARSGLDTGQRTSGALTVAADRDDAEELRRLAGLQRALGLSARWLSGRECRRLEPGLSPRVPGGIEAPDEGHVDPAATVEALRVALAEEDGELLEETAIEGIELERGGRRVVGVDVSGTGRVATTRVVVAAGAWSASLRGLPAGAAPPVRPLKGQILTMRVPPGHAPPAVRIVRTPRCYVLAREDGRVVVGATSEERGFDVRVTAEGVFRLLEAAREVLPDVDELELVEARAGLRPATPDNAPVVGPDEIDGLTWATGHGRNGVLLAPITADAVAAAACGEGPPEAVAPFGPDRFVSRSPRAGAPNAMVDVGGRARASRAPTAPAQAGNRE